MPRDSSSGPPRRPGQRGRKPGGKRFGASRAGAKRGRRDGDDGRPRDRDKRAAPRRSEKKPWLPDFPATMPTREVAVRAVLAVLEGRSLDQVVRPLRQRPDRARLFAMIYGTVREYFVLKKAVERVADRTIPDLEITATLVVGAYQLLHMRQAPHAIVDASVDIARHLGKASASGFVNAILRRVEPIDARPEDHYPGWLTKRITKHFAGETASILDVSQSRAPLVLRVNTTKITPADYRAMLDERSIGYVNGLLDETIILESPQPAEDLPGYTDGAFAVQDAAAQLVVEVVAAKPGERILDMCAAPGGKTFHLAERLGDARSIVSIDRDKAQLDFARREANRLGHDATFVEADAMTLDWWDQEPFDRILVDAPCSGTGTLRRHPDIKLNRRPGDIEAFAERQYELLRAVWRTLRPGGTLIYTTCSILPEENDDVVSRLLETESHAISVPILARWGRASAHGRLHLPVRDGGDGFYYARIGKR